MNPILFRRLIAVTLLLSFVAMSTSGIMMFVVERPSFTIAMHPVHKLFGLLMVFGASGHLWLNRRPMMQHLRQRSGMVAATILTVLLVLTYGVVSLTDTQTPAGLLLDSLANQLNAK